MMLKQIYRGSNVFKELPFYLPMDNEICLICHDNFIDDNLDDTVIFTKIIKFS